MHEVLYCKGIPQIFDLEYRREYCIKLEIKIMHIGEKWSQNWISLPLEKRSKEQIWYLHFLFGSTIWYADVFNGPSCAWIWGIYYHNIIGTELYYRFTKGEILNRENIGWMKRQDSKQWKWLPSFTACWRRAWSHFEQNIFT